MMVNDYLEVIGRVPLLTPDEEIKLARAIQAAQSLEEKTDLTLQERRALARGRKAKERMVSANLRLCFNIAKKYANNRNCLSILDLTQEGALGCVRAAEKFDPTRGYKFSTFAYWWIRQAINRAIKNQDDMIRLPCHRAHELRKFRNAMTEALQGGSGSIDPAEVAKNLKINYANIRLSTSLDVISLDTLVNHNNEKPTPLLELIPDARTLDNDQEVDHEPNVTLLTCLSRLNDVERRIIEMRYFQDMNCTQVSKELGESYNPDRVSSISRKAISKLRQLFSKQEITEQQELAV